MYFIFLWSQMVEYNSNAELGVRNRMLHGKEHNIVALA